MVIRKALILSLVAIGTVYFGSAASTMAQGVRVPVHSPLEPVHSDGLILSAEDVPLGEGETIIAGPPEMMHLHGGAPAAPYHGAGHPYPQVLDPGIAGMSGAGCFAPCDPGYYAIGEALYMRLDGDGEGFDPSDSFQLGFDEFDYELGARLTVGRRFDCVNGYEFVYAGQLEWTDSQVANGVGIDTQLFPITILDDLAGADPDVDVPLLDPFFGSTQQSQFFNAQYDSFEFNRTYNGWDVVRVYFGARAVRYDEDYLYRATDATGTGSLAQSVENLLIGAQLGLDTSYPLSNRLFLGSRVKGGAYLNLVDSDASAQNNGAVFARVSRDEEELAGLFEARTSLGYHLTDCMTVTVGYEVWYLAGLATALDQNVIAGGALDVDEDVFIHGATAGLEVSF